MNMAYSRQVVFICALLLAGHTATALDTGDVVVGVVAGAAAVVAAPVVLGAAGFGAAGIAAGSVGAKVMSVAWTAGAGMGAVGTLQAAGAAGLTLAQMAVVWTAAGATTVAVTKAMKD